MRNLDPSGESCARLTRKHAVLNSTGSSINFYSFSPLLPLSSHTSRIVHPGGQISSPHFVANSSTTHCVRLRCVPLSPRHSYGAMSPALLWPPRLYSAASLSSISLAPGPESSLYSDEIPYRLLPPLVRALPYHEFKIIKRITSVNILPPPSPPYRRV